MEPILPPLQAPKPPKKISVSSLVGIFALAFIIILAILNGPSLVKSIAYPFSHSEESDNEKLTQQYRDLYGYERHPEIITSVQSAIKIPQPSSTPILNSNNQIITKSEIRIPKINISAPIVQVADTNDSTILAALKNGVVIYPGSVNPGQSGTTVIIGHSSSNLPWTKYSAIFSLLGKLQSDDLIYVINNGVEYTYRIKAVQKGSAQQLIDSGVTGDLIVATCWPIGTDANRIAISANLVR
ncbi:MAG: sortase [Patescibacteria group bacterium]